MSFPALAPFFRLRRLPALAALLLALAAFSLLPGSDTARAQTATTLVSNTGQTAGANSAIVGFLGATNFEQGALFTTGANAGGYTLSAVDVFLHSTSASSSPKVSIYSTTAAGLPDSELHVLTNPASITSNAVNTFTAPANTTLAANTTFAVVFKQTGGSGSWSASSTTTGDEDAGAASGWSITDGRVSRNATTNSAWGATTDHVFRFAVKGSAITQTKLVSNTGQTPGAGHNLTRDSAQAFTTGSNSGGYRLTRADISLGTSGSAPGTAPTFTVTVHSNSTSGCGTGFSSCPGASLGTLTLNGAAFGTDPARFDASGSGIAVAASTKLWLQLDVTAGPNANYARLVTASDNEDTGGAAGWSIGNDFIMRTSTDTTGWTSTGNHPMQIAIYGKSNNAPTVANAIPDQSARTGRAFNYAFPANTFADSDGDTLTYTATKSDGTALPSWLTFTAATRTFSGMPQAANVGTVSVKVTASDGNGGSISDTFDIVVAANSAPTVANPLPDGGAVVGTAFNYGIPADTFADADGDTLTYTATKGDGTALPSWLTLFSAFRRLSGTPTAGDVGTVSVKVTASDGNGGSVSDTFDIVVKATNSAPTVANPIPDQRAVAGAAFSYAFPANTFADSDAGDTLTYTARRFVPLQGRFTLEPLPSWLTFTESTRTFSGTPASGDAGTVAISVSASDGFASVSDTFIIVVKASNAAPTVANAIPDQSARTGRAFSYQFPANTFADSDAGDTLTYTATRSNGGALPSWLTFTAATRTFSGTPAAEGTVSVKVTASDGVASVSDTFDIAVTTFVYPPISLRAACQPDWGWVPAGYWYVNKLYAFGGGDRLIPCDMNKPGWAFDQRSGRHGHNRWVYDGTPGFWDSGNNPAPPRDQPVALVTYKVPGDPDHRAVRGTDGQCYREERLPSDSSRGGWTAGGWYRSRSYGSGDADCRNAAWNAYYRSQPGHDMIDPAGGTVALFPAGEPISAPLFESAAVQGTALAVTFHQDLMTGVLPPSSSAFQVTVNNARRSVARDGVAIVGDKVWLTLSSAVREGDTVKVRYRKPTSNPLQGANNLAVDTITDYKAVTNQVIWSATITTNRFAPDHLARGCSNVWADFYDNAGINCPTRLTDDSFTYRGTTYRFTAIEYSEATDSLFLVFDKALPEGLTLHVGDVRLAFDEADFLNVNGFNARWNEPGFVWDSTRRVQLHLAIGETLLAPPAAPAFESASADGTALTVTFDQDLNTGQVPSHGAFRVTVNDARRNVASGGVAVSGKTVTLTLASAVSAGDTVKVRYTKPSRNPLRGADGLGVDGFADKAVTNQVIWSATLTVSSELTANGEAVGHLDGCIGTGQSRCSGLLTVSSLTHSGTTYQVTQVTAGKGQLFGYLFVEFDQAAPQLAALYVDGRRFDFADATSFSSGKGLRWSNSGLTWTAGQRVSLRLTEGSDGASGVTGNAGEQVPSVSVTGVSVASDAGADRTYGGGDKIEVQVTFNQLVVDVDTSGGAPRIRIDMDPAEWGEKWAEYDSGTGTSSLTFVHTVAEPNLSTQGIAVLANTLELNGGAITAAGEDAALGHQGLAHDADHKVDWQVESDTGSGPVGLGTASAPTVTAVAVTSDPGDDDTYGKDDVIRIALTFDEAVEVTGSPRLKIDMDPAEWGEKHAGYASGSGSTTLVFTHTVVEPNLSTQGIAVLANSLELNGGVIRSTASHADAELAHTGLGHDSGHKVDWEQAPAVTAVAITSDPASGDTYGLGDVITISVTFDEAVNVTGAPRIAIDMDPAEWGRKLATYHRGSGSTTLVFTHTVVEPNYSTQGIAVLEDSLELNGGTIASTADSTAADLSHTGLAHDADHKVNWEQDDGGPGS